MAQDLYNQGFSQFLKDPLPDAQVKSHHPQWRAGYKAAEKNHNARNKVALKPEKVEQVQRGSLEITWALITQITQHKRFERLNRTKELYPMLASIRKNLWESRDTIKGYRGLIDAANEQFDLILQTGYNQKVLTKEDCVKYGYIPK